MKGSSMTTHMGNITIDNEVIGQYAGTVAMECFGIVGMVLDKIGRYSEGRSCQAVEERQHYQGHCSYTE